MSAFDRSIVAKGVPSDRSFALTGTPQLLVAKNTIQRCIEVTNPGIMSIGISFTTTSPAVGAAGTITIPSLGSWRNPDGFLPVSDIYVVGPAGQSMTCWFY